MGGSFPSRWVPFKGDGVHRGEKAMRMIQEKNQASSSSSPPTSPRPSSPSSPSTPSSSSSTPTPVEDEATATRQEAGAPGARDEHYPFGMGAHRGTQCQCQHGVRRPFQGSVQVEPPPREPVLLNVYDLFWTNDYSARLGLGIYHSGVQVYGREWSFGYHDMPVTGIYHHNPRDAGELGRKFQFNRALVLGMTDFREKDIGDIIELFGRDYAGQDYHLVKRNCNVFANEFSEFLTGNSIPHWVNRPALAATCIPMWDKCVPREWNTPDALVKMLSSLRVHDRDVKERTREDERHRRRKRKEEERAATKKEDEDDEDSSSSSSED